VTSPLYLDKSISIGDLWIKGITGG
jgi:hypothetical protein